MNSRRRRGKLVRMSCTPSLKLAQHIAGTKTNDQTVDQTVQDLRYKLGFHNEQYLVGPDSYLPNATAEDGIIPWAQPQPGSVIITLRDPVTYAGTMVHFKELDSMGEEDPNREGIFYTLRETALPSRPRPSSSPLEVSLVTIGTKEGQMYQGPILRRFDSSAKRERIRVLGQKSYPASSSDLVEVHLDPHSGLVICYVRKFDVRKCESRKANAQRAEFDRNMRELFEGPERIKDSDEGKAVYWSCE